MNTKNLEFLQDAIKYLGFDTALSLEMARHMQQGASAFTLNTRVSHFKDEMSATLHFRKSDNNDMYFLNKYDASLRKEDGSMRAQTFYINKNAGITFKEAYNLLSGRAVNKDLVNKDGERYNAWVQLDFDQKGSGDNFKVKQYSSNYGYDLEVSVARHPVKELLDSEQKDKLMRSLSRGNIQSVTFTRDGQEERMYLEANPQFKTVTVYDNQMKKIYQDNSNKTGLTGTVTAEKSQTPGRQIQDNDNRKSLLPKKKTAPAKGQRI